MSARRTLHSSVDVRAYAEDGGQYTVELLLHKSTTGTYQDSAWKVCKADAVEKLARHAGALKARLEEVNCALLALIADGDQ